MIRLGPVVCALAVCLAAGCKLSPDYTGTHYRCDEDHHCPGSLQCIDNLCQDSLVGGIDASTDDASAIDASAVGACGGGTPLLVDDFEGDAVDAAVWAVGTDNSTVEVVDGRLSIEPQDQGASATVTTKEAYAVDGTRLTIEVLPVGDITSSGVSVAVTQPDSSIEMATIWRDTFDLVLHTDAGNVDQLEYDSGDHRFWRFEFEGDEIRFYASADGTSWNLLATAPDAVVPLDGDLSIWVENYAGQIQPYRFDSIAWCTLE